MSTQPTPLHFVSTAHLETTPLPAEQPANQRVPTVGIGASAGGLEAFGQLLAHLPADTGMAFVLIQHLDPKHVSQLGDLLAKGTAMPLLEAAQGLTVRPDHVYVIPPNTTLTIAEGVLQLAPRGGAPHMPIDDFFGSLAEDGLAGAIGVILSGSGSDGTLGLEEIKAAGGITLAQDEESAKYPAMPQSAVRGGSVDFVLDPAGIARELVRIGRHPSLSIPALPSDGDRPAPGPAAAAEEEAEDEEQFRRILALLRASTGVDFSAYRDTMIRRRIRRRLLLSTRRNLADYVRQLEGDDAELETLYQDILINVTRFFREPGTFEALKASVFPEIARAKAPGMPFRIWVPGCSTGQEAYSLAIALLEFLDGQPVRPLIQIFATDLSDSRSLRQARAGVYSASIEADVSEERLGRFFTRDDDGSYRVNKAIRDMCVFARQNVAADPPFSRIDLISCRNLLIYLAPPLQKRVLSTFHYALNPNGFLLLGAAETVGPFSDLLELTDHQHRIFAKKGTAVRQYPHFQSEKHAGAAGAGSAPYQAGSSADWQRETDRIVLGQYAPAGVLVDDNLEVVHFRGQTGPYLAPAPGDASFNVLRMAREGLFLELRSALGECRQDNAPVRRHGVRVHGDGQVHEIDLRVLPVKLPRASERCFLVLFENDRRPDGGGQEAAAVAAAGPALPSETGPRGLAGWLQRRIDRTSARPAAASGTASPSPGELELARLRQELVSTGEYLQSVIEEQEAANEDLKSANEEILSSNEELQSTNEELETAKEELQSVNEELTTVNEQLQYSNVELSRLNDDFTNLLGSARVPMVALDVNQRIRRFTPAAAKLLNLLPVDIGRSIGSLKPHLDEPDLEALVAEVIATAQVEEREVRDRHGCWYALRIYPYRTADDRIDGAVVVLVGIDEVKGAQERLQKARDFAQAVVGTIGEPLLVLDAELRVQSANPAFHETFAVGPGEAAGRLLGKLGGGQWDIPALGRLLREVLTQNTALVDFEVTREFAALGQRALLLNARAIHSAERASGEPELILLAIRDVSHRKQLENELLESSRQLTEAGRRKDEFLATLAHELRNPLAPILNSLELIEHLDSRAAAAGKARGIVKRQVSHMVRLIDDLLDISRVTTGRVRLCRERVDLAGVVDQAVEAIRPALEAAGHRLVIDPAAEPLVLDADPVRLVQIVENLLSNAVKYTVQGAGGIELRTARQDGQAVLRVRDAGIGIAPEMLAHVWELFMQVDPTYERSQSGLGIGLALVRSLAELHGGSVEVTSAGLGEGSEFTVRLPLADVSGVTSVASVTDTADLAGPAGSPSAEVPGDAAPAGPPLPATPRAHRILVLDDNLDQAGSLSLLLTLWGHDVRTTHDGPAALEEAAAFRPEVVILDIGLPGMDGHEVARRLRRNPALGQTVLIALSGYGTDEDRRQSQEAGIDTHLVKPVEPGALRALLSELGPKG